MKTCSYCGQQNDDAALKCSGCGTTFPAPDPGTTDPALLDPSLSLVTVATFHNIAEAQLLLTRLEDAGIEACIPEEYTAQVFSALIPFELVTVRVAAKDYEEARAVVAEEVQAFADAASENQDGGETAKAPTSATENQAGVDLEDGVPCVSCRALIPSNSHLCPKCGWTQPAPAPE